MNLGFYVSGKATRLSKILDIKNTEMIKSIKFVFSDDDNTDYLKEKLLEMDIPYILLDYKSILTEGKDKNLILSNKLLQILDFYDVDYCFSFGNHILKGILLEKYKNKIINFHPSILPQFPGRNAIDKAIEAGVNILGNTAHFIDKGIDTGPIILQSVQSVNVFYEKGYNGILDVQVDMYKKIYQLIKNNKIIVMNNKVHIEGANYIDYEIIPNID